MVEKKCTILSGDCVLVTSGDLERWTESRSANRERKGSRFGCAWPHAERVVCTQLLAKQPQLALRSDSEPESHAIPWIQFSFVAPSNHCKHTRLMDRGERGGYDDEEQWNVARDRIERLRVVRRKPTRRHGPPFLTRRSSVREPLPLSVQMLRSALL
jgi:hypothetical protein